MEELGADLILCWLPIQQSFHFSTEILAALASFGEVNGWDVLQDGNSLCMPPYAGRPGCAWRRKRCIGEGGVMSIRNLTVTPSHCHPCAETSSDPSDARDLAPHSPAHRHCQECTLGLTQSNGRFFSPDKALAAPEHRGLFSEPCKKGVSWVLVAVEGAQPARCRRVQGLSCTGPS